MKNLINCTFALLIAVAALSCDRPECTNTNPVFDKFLPAAEEYKAELAKQLQKDGDITYWIDRYEERNGQPYLHVFIQGDSLCARGIVQIGRSDETAADVIKAKAGGYHGAELCNPELEIHQDTSTTTFSFASLGRIID